MPDISIIRETYAALSEEELLRLASEEGLSLTPEALTLLYQEFVKRGMDTDLIASIRAGIYQRRNHAERTERDLETVLLREAVVRFAMERMEEGKTREEVVEELERLGIGSEHGVPMLSTLTDRPDDGVTGIGSNPFKVFMWAALIIAAMACAIEASNYGSAMIFIVYAVFRLVGVITDMRRNEDGRVSSMVREWKSMLDDDGMMHRRV